MIEQFEAAGGKDKPRFGQVHVCWADDEEEAKKTALEWWPNAVAGGNLPWELPLPSHSRTPPSGPTRRRSPRRSSAGRIPSGTSRRSREFVEAGYDHVYLHQVGPDQVGFIEFAERELLPRLDDVRG